MRDLKDPFRVVGEKYDRLSNQHYIKEPIESEGTEERGASYS